MALRCLAGVCTTLLTIFLATSVRAGTILFDATKREMAGNADWVIDADLFNLNLPAYPCSGSTNESRPQRIPTPAQSGIGAATPETYWTGGISAWAVDLVKAGHAIETLPPGAAITFGDARNPQDLSLYDVFVVVEPQNPFTTDEKAAILSFVAAGGGLFMVGDHETSDRDCDGFDSPHVWNDMTGAMSPAATGVFGIWFRVNGLDDSGSEDWFDEGVNANVETDPADPILHGPFGTGSGGLGLFGSTSMDINPADNPAVRAHVWRNGQAHGNVRVTFATSTYGSGRVAAIGDSSPADDDTGDPADNLHPGWDKASGGVNNREIHLNACHWLLNPAPDIAPPVITNGPTASPSDCSARVLWTTDEAATTSVGYGPNAGYGSNASISGHVQSHAVTLAPLVPASTYHYRVSSSDVAGNGPTQSADATFDTTAAAAPAIVFGPSVSAVTGASATIGWTTDEIATSEVEFGLTDSYGSNASRPGTSVDHAVALAGLAPLTPYHFRVRSSDSCDNGPTLSADATFTTGPAAIDVSGWTLRQFGSTQTWVIPNGTMIPSGGYLVVARNASRSEFEAVHASMPAATVFLNSNANGSCASVGCFPQINGGESYELADAFGVLADGPTIMLATTHDAFQRRNPGDPAGSGASWLVVAESFADPGQGAGTASGAGVRLNEIADAADFNREYVEIYNDAVPSGPDTVAPAAITSLLATPLSDSEIRLTWTATGDDGTTGTAAAYDIRRSSRRILTAADFAAAVPLPGEPSPQPAGSVENFTVTSLAADTPYHFALRVADEVPNVSGLSNSSAGVTAPAGSSQSANHLVISHVQVAGSTNDVIELYNPTAAAISLANHSVQYLAANGNFGFRLNLSSALSVPAHGWYLVAGSGYTGPPSSDQSLGSSNNMSATAGHALLASTLTNVSGCSDTAIVDRVGYGASATCPEGGSGENAASPGSGLAIERRPGGASGNGQDTDNNSDDFLAPASPVYHNRTSTPATPPGSLGNVGPTLFLTQGTGATTLDWANAAGATGYRVFRGTAPDFMLGGPSPWQTAAAPTVFDATVPSPIFYYVVRATDGTSESQD